MSINKSFRKLSEFFEISPQRLLSYALFCKPPDNVLLQCSEARQFTVESRLTDIFAQSPPSSAQVCLAFLVTPGAASVLTGDHVTTVDTEAITMKAYVVDYIIYIEALQSEQARCHSISGKNWAQ